MSARIRIDRAGPLTTIQDRGRYGMMAHGISASGPMDRAAFAEAVGMAGSPDGVAIEFTRAGLDLTLVSGAARLAWSGGQFNLRRNGEVADWPGAVDCTAGDRISITPGPAGNYGYLAVGSASSWRPCWGAGRPARGSGSAASRAGRCGRAIFSISRARDRRQSRRTARQDGGRRPSALHLGSPCRALRSGGPAPLSLRDLRRDRRDGPHGRAARRRWRRLCRTAEPQPRLGADRGGDIQILGDGTPIVLMRDHQPTGGYPRIGTVIGADLDRFAQMRPESRVAFTPITVDHAHALRRGQAQ